MIQRKNWNLLLHKNCCPVFHEDNPYYFPAFIQEMCDFTNSTSNEDIENITPTAFMPNPPKAKLILKDIIKMDSSNYKNTEGLNACLRLTAKKYKYQTSKRELGMIYRKLLKIDPINYPYIEDLWNILINRSVRSESGIVNVSIF